jgi:hypothetical protein
VSGWSPEQPRLFETLAWLLGLRDHANRLPIYDSDLQRLV